MKDISILREAEPGIGFGWKLLQDPASNGADVAGRRAEFCKNDRSTRNESVEDRHRSLSRSNRSVDGLQLRVEIT